MIYVFLLSSYCLLLNAYLWDHMEPWDITLIGFTWIKGVGFVGATLRNAIFGFIECKRLIKLYLFTYKNFFLA